MKIDFFEISAEGLSLTLENAQWFPENLVLKQFHEAEMFLKRYERRVLVKGCLFLVVVMDCDRCLDSFDMTIQTDFQVDLELVGDSDALSHDADHHCHDSEMDRVVLTEPVIDIDHLLQQQVYLALPFKNLCSEQCKGCCMICGGNLNHNKCRCTPEIESPFSALAKLKKEKKSYHNQGGFVQHP